jgi:hypothetical protein
MNLRKVSNVELTWEKNKKDDLLADSHKILNRRKNYFSAVERMRGYVRQMKKHTTELLALQLSNFEVETSAEKLKRYTSPSTD